MAVLRSQAYTCVTISLSIFPQCKENKIVYNTQCNTCTIENVCHGHLSYWCIDGTQNGIVRQPEGGT